MTPFRIIPGPRCRIVTDLLENPVTRKDALAMGLNCDPQDLSPEEATGVLEKLNKWMEKQKKK